MSIHRMELVFLWLTGNVNHLPLYTCCGRPKYLLNPHCFWGIWLIPRLHIQLRSFRQIAIMVRPEYIIFSTTSILLSNEANDPSLDRLRLGGFRGFSVYYSIGIWHGLGRFLTMPLVDNSPQLIGYWTMSTSYTPTLAPAYGRLGWQRSAKSSVLCTWRWVKDDDRNLLPILGSLGNLDFHDIQLKEIKQSNVYQFILRYLLSTSNIVYLIVLRPKIHQKNPPKDVLVDKFLISYWKQRGFSHQSIPRWKIRISKRMQGLWYYASALMP
jgi:hypothetical protein